MTLGIFGFFEIFIWIWTGEDIEQPYLLGFERGEAVSQLSEEVFLVISDGSTGFE